jgi:signal transduction histidine kinase
MIVIGKIENRIFIFVLTLSVSTLIGYFDFATGPLLSFSLFYLAPLTFIALYRNTKAISVLFISIYSAVIWSLADYETGRYSVSYYFFWNTFVRMIFLSSIGLLLFYLKEKDKKLNQANSKLKQLNDEKNKFVGIAAHDMRSPLSSIFSFSEMLIDNLKDEVDDESLEILHVIRSSSKNSMVLLQHLLDVSKIEAGKVELNIRSQDYISFIKQQISLHQILVRPKNITIILQSQFDSLSIGFDNHYLGETIDNLLTNAAKFSNPYSQIIIKISLTVDRQVLTEVIDEGKGIPEAEQNNLFKYFQTTSTRPTAGEQSTGLGLAIAKQIVLLHNGEIGLKSVVNKGSTFYYTLPQYS